MNYKDEIIDFVVKGFKNIYNPCSSLTNINHSFVLKDKKNNFITLPPKDFKYHMWASSLKSSQAFAYNVFSGVKNPTLQFEFPMEVFDRDAQIDVMIENMELQTIELFEVKAFEICSLGKNKITFEEKYFTKNQYKRLDIAEQFITFLKTVITTFENQKIYGGGVKQICSHLLGIINIMDKPDYKNKKFKLYSFCFDNLFSNKFENDINNYKKTLTTLKRLVDDFFKDIKIDSRVDYSGFLSANEFVNQNKTLLGKKNYDYVSKRYFYS